jgi:serine/threonine protein kinase
VLKPGGDLDSSLLFGDGSEGGSGLRAFTLAQLSTATDNFSDTCKLAEGGFGAVYRGRLRRGGTAVAIKVLRPEAAAVAAPNKKAEQYLGIGGFRREAEVLTKYRHRNIVELLGSCLSDNQSVKQCLVFEFMVGGSLKGRLATGVALTAQQRFDIASDVARGIRFLHVSATPPIIHQDVKSDNVLLDMIDGQLVAKLADFGTARYADELLLTGVSKIRTLNVIVSRGYAPMEYLQSGIVSEKTDTYAFGVVLCELLTGSPPVSTGGEMLATMMNTPLEDPEQALPPLLDTRLGGGGWPFPRAFALGRVARRCIEMLVQHRCVVAEVLCEVDELAKRLAVRRAGRGEEYDPFTGKLVRRS